MVEKYPWDESLEQTNDELNKLRQEAENKDVPQDDREEQRDRMKAEVMSDQNETMIDLQKDTELDQLHTSVDRLQKEIQSHIPSVLHGNPEQMSEEEIVLASNQWRAQAEQKITSMIQKTNRIPKRFNNA